MQTEPMVALELNAVLWSNWQAWAAGGVTDSEIMAHLTEADLVKLPPGPRGEKHGSFGMATGS